jgi:hypothetical protein
VIYRKQQKKEPVKSYEPRIGRARKRFRIRLPSHYKAQTAEKGAIIFPPAVYDGLATKTSVTWPITRVGENIGAALYYLLRDGRRESPGELLKALRSMYRGVFLPAQYPGLRTNLCTIRTLEPMWCTLLSNRL